MRFPEEGLKELRRAVCPPFLLTRIDVQIDSSLRRKRRQRFMLFGLAFAIVLLLLSPLTQQRGNSDQQLAQFVYQSYLYPFSEDALSEVEIWKEREEDLFWATLVLNEESTSTEDDTFWSDSILQDNTFLGGEV